MKIIQQRMKVVTAIEFMDFAVISIPYCVAPSSPKLCYTRSDGLSQNNFAGNSVPLAIKVSLKALPNAVFNKKRRRWYDVKNEEGILLFENISYN